MLANFLGVSELNRTFSKEEIQIRLPRLLFWGGVQSILNHRCINLSFLVERIAWVRILRKGATGTEGKGHWRRLMM
jgi:hypothetical protein